MAQKFLSGVQIIAGDENTLYLDTGASGQQTTIFYQVDGSYKYQQRVGTNWELYNYTTSNWDFHIGGSTGYLALGHNSPSARLHLSGDNSAKSAIRQSRTGVVIWDQAIDSSGRLQWGTRTSEGGSRTVRFTLDDNGYNAIGSHAPTAALDVKGTTNLASRFIFTKDLSTDKILFGGADHDSFDTFIGSSSNHSFTITQNGAAAITIDTSKKATFAGDINIGTNTLYIENNAETSDGDGTASMTDSGQDSIVLKASSGADGHTMGGITWMSGSRRRAMITSVLDGNTDTDYQGIAFYTRGTDGAGDFYETMRLKHNGTLQIGTLTSGRTGGLIVNQEGGVTPVAKFMSRTNKAIVQVSDNDTTGYISSENGLFSIGRNGGVNATNININASHQVLMGASTSSFNDKLYILGDAYTTGGWRVGTSATFVGKLINDSGKLSLMSDGSRDVQIGNNNTPNIIEIDTSAQSTTFTKQNGSPTINMLWDGNNPSSGTLLHYLNYKVDYDGTHQDWGGIEHRTTSASSVRTQLNFNVKSQSGNVQNALSLQGQPSAVPNAIFAGDVTGEKFILNDGFQISSSGTYGVFNNWVNVDSTGFYTSTNIYMDLDDSSSRFVVRGVSNTEIFEIDTSDSNSSKFSYPVKINAESLYGLTSTGGTSPKTELGGFITVPGAETSRMTYLTGVSENKLGGLYRKGSSAGYSLTSTKDGSSISANWLENAFQANDNFSSLSSTTSSTVCIIEITMPTMYHGSNAGIAFSNGAWRAKNVKIEIYNGSSWSTIYDVTNSGRSAHINYFSQGSTGVTKLKYTLTNFNSTSCRISSIFANNYSGGSGVNSQLYADNTLYGNQTIQSGYSMYAPIYYETGSTTNYLDLGNTSTSLKIPGIISMADNKAVTWSGGSIRAEGNTLKLVATTLIDLQDNTQVQGNLNLVGDSRILNLAGGSTTNSQSRLIIGEQGTYGVSFRWDSSSSLQFDGFWNSSVTGSTNRDLGAVNVNTKAWTFNDTVSVSSSVTAGSFVKSGGTSSQFLMADGSVSTGGGGSIDGSGASNRIAIWSDSDTLTSSASLFTNGSGQVKIGTFTNGSSNSGEYADDDLVIGDGSISIYPHRRGDYGLDATTATSTTFRSKLNIWSDNEDHITFGGASTHMVSAWESWKIWINNDSGSAGTLHLYNKSSKTEFARFSGSGTSWINGTFTGNTDLRAPIFYDSNNTGYYANPASRSNFGDLDLNSGAVWDATTQGTSKGSLHIDPNSATDHAGGSITWGASDAGGGQTAQAGIYVRSDGSYGTRMYFSTTDSYNTGSKTAMNIQQNGQVNITRSNLIVNTDVRAPLFYDSNNTAFYVNPASTSVVNHMDMDSGNTSGKFAVKSTGVHASYDLYNDGTTYLNGAVTVDADLTVSAGDIYGKSVNNAYSNLYRFGGIYFTWDSDSYGTNFNHSITSTYNGSYGDNLTINSYGRVRINIDSNGNGNDTFEIGRHTTGSANTMLSLNESSQLTVNGDVRTPIFYDSNDTNYYADLASSTSINLAGRITGNSSQNRVKYSVWTGSTYGIGMKNGFSYGHIGSGEYCMTFQMNDSSARGFWWGDTGHTDAQGAMSLTTNGKLTVATSISVGEGETVTSPNSSTLYVDGTSTFEGAITIDSDGATDNYYINMNEAGSNRFTIYENSNNVYFNGWAGHTIFRPRMAGSGSFAVTQGNNQMSTSGAATFAASVSSPIFYDSNDTNHYVNPASTSYLNHLRAKDDIVGGNLHYDPNTLLAVHENDTTESIRNKFDSTFSGITKVDDSTAPAQGCFQVSGATSPSMFGKFHKIDEGDEFIFEFWIKFVSGTDTDSRIYAGAGFYDASKTYLGNSQRYWGESAVQVDTNSNNSGWYHVSGTLGPNRGSSTGDIPTSAEWMKLLFLFNYQGGDTVTRYCGLHVRRSNPVFTSIMRKTLGSQFGSTTSTKYPDTVPLVDSDGDIHVGHASGTNQARLRLHGSTANVQSTIMTTNGNLHIDSQTGSNVYFQHYSNGWVYMNNAGGHTQSFSSMRAPIFYDSNDTNYFVNPASNSTLLEASIGTTAGVPGGYRLNMGGSIDMNANNIDYVSQLHFNDNVRFQDMGNDSYLKFKWGDSGAGGIRFYDGNDTHHGYVYGDGSGGFGLLDKDSQWFVYTNGSSSTQLRCDNSVKIQLGTSTTTVQNSTFLVNNTNNHNFGTGGTGNIYVGGNTSGQYFRIHHNNSSTYLDAGGAYIYMRSNNGSNTRFRFGAGTDGGTLIAAGDVVAYGSPSDKTLKENIKPIENALDKVSKLKGVEFDWKKQDITNLKEDIGFIAQDVQEVLPQLVRKNENGKLSLRHQGIVPVLVEAIKDLKAELDELKKQINNG